jgi:hypothetical protein
VSKDSAALAGNWTHSYEEDGADVQVYRPTHGFAFPLSRRGRETLAFGAGGQLLSGAPGPDDRQVIAGSMLTSLGMSRYRVDGGVDGGGGGGGGGGGELAAGQVIEIVESDPSVLKIRLL